MTQWTPEVDARLREYLFRPGYEIPSGLGTEEAACSVAAINLALSGELTDSIPDCMSPVVGRWIIGVQDAMPAAMRNSREWRELLALAAGTGREREQERLAIVLDWMRETVLPTVQPLADEHGFGDQWRRMCEQRTEAAAAWAEAAEAAAAAEEAAVAAAAVAAVWAVAAEAAARAEAVVVAAAWEKFGPIAVLERLVNA